MQSIVIDFSPADLPENQLWNDEYAQDVANKAFDFQHAFIRDDEAFQQLWQQAEKRDKNALFYVLRVKFSSDYIFNQEMAEHDERILTYYTPAQQSILNGYDERKQNTNNLLALAELGHPATSLYIFQNLSDYWFAKLGSNDQQQQQKVEMLLKHAIDGGYNYHQLWAEYAIFDLDKAWQVSLQQHKRELTQKQLKNYIDNGYMIAAMNGGLFPMIRMSEAYLWGIGVEQDYAQAYIWAKLVDTSFPILYAKQKEVNDQDAEQSLMSLHKAAMKLVDDAKQHLSVNQLIQLQSSVDQLMQQIDFHYDEWASERRPIKPMR